MDEHNEEINYTDSGEETGTQRATRNRKNSGARKAVGNLWDNIKGAFRGNKKDIFVLKVKSVLYAIIAVLVFFALIIEGNAEETSKVASSTTASVYSNSSTESAEMYNSTGSLILATDAELQEITKNYLDNLEKTNEGYYNALSAKYSGKESSTIANRVAHITSNYESGETKEVDVIKEKATSVSGATSTKDEKTIYEHILRTEKYNFNNIIWRSYVKSGSGVKSADMSFRVDSDSKLKYPVSDSNAINNEDLDLEFFITKVRPYLQSWYIPFDIMVGTQDAQSTSNLNADLAYEIITSAYHEIVLDRYKLEKLTRTTNYLVYDKTTTTTTTQRTCADYEKTTTGTETVVDRAAGSPCTSSDKTSECKDAVKSYKKTCTKDDYKNGKCTDKKIGFIRGEGQLWCSTHYDSSKCNDKLTVNCSDAWDSSKCSYGTLKEDKTKKVGSETKITKTYCTDTIAEPDINIEKGIRESKVNGTKDTDKLTYSWNYVITMAKMLDKVISNEYEFQAYYEYSLDNYNKFINKKDNYKDITVEDFRKKEQEDSKADDFAVKDEDYKVIEDPVVDNSNSNWNKDNVVDAIPEGYSKKGNSTTKTIKKVVEVTKEGKEYTDTYNWGDNLKFDESKSGIYNVDSVKDVTGDDLTYADEEYYNNIYADQELNLMDLMNSDKEIYKNYIEKQNVSNSTENIGIRKSALDISYNVLKQDLKQLAESYPLSGLMYGNSLDLLEGLNLGMVAGAGGVNEAIVLVADAHLGYDLDQMLSLNHHGIFFRNHWCAMFVSYCMRTVEAQAGINIPIPNYTSCTTFWKGHNNKPGFFDVQEWVERNQGGECVQRDPNHIAPLSSIQPGDIILYCWTSAGDRDHTAIVKSVEKDANGNVTAITTIDGNWGGSGRGEPSYNYSSVKYAEHTSTGGSSYTSLSSIASFVSISTVLAEAEQGNTW